MLAGGAAWAQPAGPKTGPGIFTCQDDRGRTLNADRPIAECADRPQRVLNRDGSLQRILPPSYTPQERAAAVAKDAALKTEAERRRDAVRRDRNLIARYPDEASHDRARTVALSSLNASEQATLDRIKALQAARKPLMAEAEFYVDKPRPAQLRRALADNDAALEAQRHAAMLQKTERERIVASFDAEREHLRRLWAGAAPGSLGDPASAAARPASAPADAASPRAEVR